MEKANIKDITFDEEDAKLLKLKTDLLLKAKSIQYSILPKLNVVLEEALSRVRKIYDVEVFNEDSYVHYSPHFREQRRKNNLKIDYTYAIAGITGARKPIWKGFERKDGKPVKIMGFSFGFTFIEQGMVLGFGPANRLHLSDNSFKKYLDFIRQNSPFVQAILLLSGMMYFPKLKKKSNSIIPFDNLLDELIEEKCYRLIFKKRVPFPVGFNQLNDLIDDFVVFYPIYDSMVRIAKGEKIIFEELTTKLKNEDIYKETENIEEELQNSLTDEEEQSILQRKIDEKNVVKAGVRWQVFERDDFKCVACGISAREGAILHIDHILPRSKGGKDEMNNYQTLCHKCNIGKSNKSQVDLRKTSPDKQYHA